MAAVLIDELPEPGRLNEREIAVLTCMAPLNRDSGQYCGQLRVWNACSPMRTIPCIATVTAIRHNPAIRAFHARLCRCGKLRKVMLVAAMRKLQAILNTVRRASASVPMAAHGWRYLTFNTVAAQLRGNILIGHFDGL